jgi:hypothetical protein
MIRSHLEQRLNKGRWPLSTLSRPCLRHWLTNLARQTLARLTDGWNEGLISAFDQLTATGITPVGRIV